jgi:glycosyltransferase involved in cell wall biosynthesis
VGSGPKYSIIIPSLDEGDWIKKTVDGLLADKSGPESELIVVDDGSTDGSCGFLKAPAYRSVRFSRIEHQGPSHARNEGARLASGDWLIFLDAHTFFDTGWLRKIDGVLRTHPDVKLLGAQCCGLGSQVPPDKLAVYAIKNQSWIENAWIVVDAPGAPDALFKVPFLNGACLVIGRAVFDACGGFPTFIQGGVGREDMALTMVAYYLGFDAYLARGICAYFHAKSSKADDKDGIAAYNSFSKLYVLCGEEDLRAAIDDFTPSGNALKLGWARFQAAKPELDQVRAELRAASKRGWEDFKREFADFLPHLRVLEYQSALRRSVSDPAEAKRELRSAAAISLPHDRFDKPFFLAMVYYRLSQLELASDPEVSLREAERSIRHAEDYAPSRFQAARACAALKRHREALSHFRRALWPALAGRRFKDPFDSKAADAKRRHLATVSANLAMLLGAAVWLGTGSVGLGVAAWVSGYPVLLLAAAARPVRDAARFLNEMFTGKAGWRLL